MTYIFNFISEASINKLRNNKITLKFYNIFAMLHTEYINLIEKS